MSDHDRLFDVKLNERPVHEISLSFWCPHLRPWPARMTEARAIHGDDTISLGRRERKSGSQQTLRWREMDSNHRSPVKDQLVETVLFEFPAEARKRTIGGRRSQPRDLGGDLRRDHNLRDDNDQLGWGRRQAQNGGSPDGGPMVRILLPPPASPVRTCLPRVRPPVTGRSSVARARPGNYAPEGGSKRLFASGSYPRQEWLGALRGSVIPTRS